MPDGNSVWPLCQETNYTPIDQGTMCLAPSQKPTPINYCSRDDTKIVAAAPSADWSGDSSQWTPEKKLASLDSDFRAKVQIVLEKLVAEKFQPKIFFGWRSVAVQLELYRKGRSKVKFSFHNAQKPDGTPTAYAADIIDKRWGWEEGAETNGFWKALGRIAKENGLIWGGDWKDFPDLAHIQSRQNSELGTVKTESGL